MRIAYITYEYPPDSHYGGIATYVAQIARIMVSRGHEVEIFASSPTRQGDCEKDGIREHWIRESSRVDFGIVAGHSFARRHAEHPFDVLEGPEYQADARKAIDLVPEIPLVVKMHTPSLLVAQLASRNDCGSAAKCIATNAVAVCKDVVKGRPIRPFYFSPVAMVKARDQDDIEASHARAATIVCPPTKDLSDHARLKWHVPLEAIRYAPHPFIPGEDYLGLQPRPSGLVIGFVGRLERRKGIETIVKAIPSVLRNVPDALFRFVGTASTHPELGIPYDEWTRKMVGHNLKRIEIAGRVPAEQMAKTYGDLDICIFPSIWENFPNVCLEAMAAARAIVGSKAGGMSEMLDNGRVGRLIAPGDWQSLAKDLVNLLRAPQERISLGLSARQRLLDSYNAAKIGKLMEEIYLNAISRRRSLPV